MQTPSSDEAGLQALTACCREMGRHKDIVTLYSAAFEAIGESEELATQLFMALVRVREFKQQQQVANSMFKRFGNNPYRYWGIMSIVMQAHDAIASGNERLATMMFLPLAERMLAKAADDGHLDTAECLRLWIVVLSMQNKHAEVLAVMERDMALEYRKEGPLLPAGIERDRAELAALRGLNRWGAVNVKLQQMIAADAAEWSNFLAYFESVERCESANGGDAGAEGGHTTLTEARDFVDGVCTGPAATDTRKPARSPFLAALEIRVRLAAGGCADGEDGDARSRLAGYVALFGAKQCCFSDIRPYLCLLTAEGTAGFLADADAEVAAHDDEPEAKRVQRHVTALLLRRHLEGSLLPLEGSLLPREEAVEPVVADLLARYAAVLPLGSALPYYIY